MYSPCEVEHCNCQGQSFSQYFVTDSRILEYLRTAGSSVCLYDKAMLFIAIAWMFPQSNTLIHYVIKSADVVGRYTYIVSTCNCSPLGCWLGYESLIKLLHSLIVYFVRRVKRGDLLARDWILRTRLRAKQKPFRPRENAIQTKIQHKINTQVVT